MQMGILRPASIIGLILVLLITVPVWAQNADQDTSTPTQISQAEPARRSRLRGKTRSCNPTPQPGFGPSYFFL